MLRHELADIRRVPSVIEVSQGVLTVRRSHWGKSTSQLTIAIDFDGTFAADPEAFREIVGVFQARDHQCIMVTNRPEE